MSDRAIDLALAATLAVLPLLPGGPQYFGWTSWVEAGLAALFLIRMLTRNRGQGPVPVPRVRAIVPFLAAMTGATWLALLRNNLIGSPAFLLRLQTWPAAAFVPIDQVTDPLYPMRVWLTLVEGAIALGLVASICRRAADPRRRAITALWGVLAGVGVVSAFAIFQYLTRFRLHPYWAHSNPNLVRAHSTLEDPNTLGSYLLLGIGVAIALARSTTAAAASSARDARVAVAIGVLAALALVTTMSRAAWVGAAIAALLVLSFGPEAAASTRWRRRARLALGAGVAVAIAWGVAHVALPARAMTKPANPIELVWSTIDPRVPVDAVLKQRDHYWLGAVRMATEHPIAGVGLGRFPHLVNAYTYDALTPDNAHNLFLQMLAETGAMGLLMFVLYLGAAAFALRTATRRPGADRGIASGIAFGGIGFSLTMLSGHPLLVVSCQLILGTLWALGLAATAGSSSDDQDTRVSPFWTNAIGVLACAALIVYAFAGRDAAWDGAGDPWGYSAGLYARERDDAGPFRWSGPSAVMSYTPPVAGTRAVSLGVSAFPPAAGATTTITIRAGDARVEIKCSNATWRQVEVPLARPLAAGERLDLYVDVDHVVTPSSIGSSADSRALGVMLRPPEFLK